MGQWYQRRVHGDSRTEASPDESAGQIDKMGDAKKLGFFENFMLAGVAAGVSKTVAAPIERVKLLVQNQDEMIKQGRLDKPYAGVLDCTKRVLATEGVVPFWRGNLANVLRYFPTQALNFAFKDTIKALFATPKDASNATKFATNIASGGVKYKGSIDCAVQIMKNEGFMSMMKGAGANILRGVAGAGVLAGFDTFQAMYIAWRTSL